jgi:uncharacterized membrane protein
MNMDGKSSLGYEEGTIAAICYLPGVGFYIYFAERKSNFVRFHALQSIVGFLTIGALWLLMRLIPALHLFTFIPSLLALVFSFFMMYHAHYGEEYKFPVVGSLAHKSIFECREDYLETGRNEPDKQSDPKGK